MIRKILACTVLLTTVTALAFSLVSCAGTSPPDPEETVTLEAPSASPMLGAWQALASRLSPEQMQAAEFSFDDSIRHEWFYTPVDRVGLRIGDLDADQMTDLRTLLDDGLGANGTEQAFKIVQLEELLFSTSGGREMRNPGNYYLMMFGEPTTEGSWAWRFEGHHFSASFTIVDNHLVSGTPAFFGGNPALVPEDSEVHAGLSPFSREQDLGFELLNSFDEGQRARVILAGEAPQDILTENFQRAEMGAPEGISVADINDVQHAILKELMGVYGNRMNPALHDYQMAKIRQAGVERVHFAWAGSTEPGEGHYYRIQGPTFVIEYDNTQNNANHIHSVWRDFEDDFGYEPLRQHLAVDHHLDMSPSGTEMVASLSRESKIKDDERAHQRAHKQGAAHSHSNR
ncbi:MAG TPA: DUF3500 domain-containing protein [Acidobacteriota bacterium]|nr:hypothetical protein [Acidobacteriota bacterium]HJN47114.1 DUF3500 domain-containing protein [Acidobacteriota bacterium]